MKFSLNDIEYLVTESVKRIIKEEGSEPHPSIYVGTYRKYNSGSLYGEWVDLTQFSSKKEFLNYCYKTLHADERDAELMFQDYEYIPDIFVSESHIDERFWDFIGDTSHSYSVKEAVAEHVCDVDEYFDVIDDIMIYYGCDDMKDVAYKIVEQCGLPDNLSYYFDYEAFGRDCSFDGASEDSGMDSIYEEYGVDEGDDEALGEAIVDMYGGIENIGKENLERYFDYDMYARNLETSGTWVSSDDGMIEITK